MTQQPAGRRYAGEKKPSMKRRGDVNNYHGRHVYMLTMAIEGRRPLLGTLQGRTDAAPGDADTPRLVLSPLGREVYRCWQAIPRFHPEVKILGLQLMPDHLHGILFVEKEMEQHLGQVVSGFKAGCNKAYRAMMAEAVPQPTPSPQPPATGPLPPATGPQPSATGCAYGAASPCPVPAPPLQGAASAGPLPLPSERRLKPDDRHHGLLFERGYNDLIAKGYDMLPRLIAYLKDNPRRLLLKRQHPDLFRVTFNLSVGPHTFAAIGNRFLLQQPERLAVQCSRHLSDAEIAQTVEHFLTAARAGAVLVSPAISKGEQRVMRAALDAGLPLIFITPYGFNAFSKPGHQYFNACARGQLLLLAPWPHQNERLTLTRRMCLDMNTMARDICLQTAPPEQPLLNEHH